LKPAPTIIAICLIGAGSFTSIIMLIAELKLEHDLLVFNWNYIQIWAYKENKKFKSIINRIEQLTT
jgi:hypothetical protein